MTAKPPHICCNSPRNVGKLRAVARHPDTAPGERVSSRQGAYDLAVIGAGIVGLATAWTLARRGRRSLIVLEAEPRPAAHQTGHNSGVIHSGLYYRPGSLKARNCARGREAMYSFCGERGLPHERCGKLVVATSAAELPRLHELERRGAANGLRGLRRLSREEAREREPHVEALEALWVPDTGIVDFALVASRLAEELRDEHGVEVRTRARVERIVRRPETAALSGADFEVEARNLVNCAGLQSDRIARMCGIEPGVRIVPLRGEYHELAPERRGLVRNLIYPVPDPALPFLGVHFTRTIGGAVEVGPNAVLAFSRSGYRRSALSVRDTLDFLGYGGFWRMARRHFRTAAAEAARSLSRAATARELRKMVPELAAADLRPARAGVRAQAVAPDGELVDDFRVVEAPRMLHVLNAPSPAATAAFAIADELAALAARVF